MLTDKTRLNLSRFSPVFPSLFLRNFPDTIVIPHKYESLDNILKGYQDDFVFFFEITLFENKKSIFLYFL